MCAELEGLILRLPPQSPKGSPWVVLCPWRHLVAHAALSHLGCLPLQVASSLSRGLGLPRGCRSARGRPGLERPHDKVAGGGGRTGQAGPGMCWGPWEQKAGCEAIGVHPACLSDAFLQHPREPPSEPALLHPDSCFGWEHLRNSSWGSFTGAASWAPGKPARGFAVTTRDFPGWTPHRELSQLGSN